MQKAHSSPSGPLSILTLFSALSGRPPARLWVKPKSEPVKAERVGCHEFFSMPQADRKFHDEPLDGFHRALYNTHKVLMPKNEMPSGALVLLILRVLRSGALHGYAIAQRIHVLSSEVLRVEEGALYPALQRILLKGWVTSEWGISETNRKVRFYQLTREGRKQLETELADYERVNEAIQSVLRTA
jgi:PadR family transcriptional regulator, regulatory protein PadR